MGLFETLFSSKAKTQKLGEAEKKPSPREAEPQRVVAISGTLSVAARAARMAQLVPRPVSGASLQMPTPVLPRSLSQRSSPAPAALPAPRAETLPSAGAGSPGNVTLTLADILPRIRAELLNGVQPDLTRTLRFPLAKLTSELSRGRAAVPLADVMQQCPEIFRETGILPDGEMIRLPLQKLLEQIGPARKVAADTAAPSLPAPNLAPLPPVVEIKAAPAVSEIRPVEVVIPAAEKASAELEVPVVPETKLPEPTVTVPPVAEVAPDPASKTADVVVDPHFAAGKEGIELVIGEAKPVEIAIPSENAAPVNVETKVPEQAMTVGPAAKVGPELTSETVDIVIDPHPPVADNRAGLVISDARPVEIDLPVAESTSTPAEKKRPVVLELDFASAPEPEVVELAIVPPSPVPPETVAEIPPSAAAGVVLPSPVVDVIREAVLEPLPVAETLPAPTLVAEQLQLPIPPPMAIFARPPSVPVERPLPSEADKEASARLSEKNDDKRPAETMAEAPVARPVVPPALKLPTSPSLDLPHTAPVPPRTLPRFPLRPPRLLPKAKANGASSSQRISPPTSPILPARSTEPPALPVATNRPRLFGANPLDRYFSTKTVAPTNWYAAGVLLGIVGEVTLCRIAQALAELGGIKACLLVAPPNLAVAGTWPTSMQVENSMVFARRLSPLIPRKDVSVLSQTRIATESGTLLIFAIEAVLVCVLVDGLQPAPAVHEKVSVVAKAMAHARHGSSRKKAEPSIG